jgi:calcineurin-like phosphoesterase family protein
MLTPPFYVISDTHWFHGNIVKYCGRDMNHNNIMVERWNKHIDPDDYVLHLGDLYMNRNEKKRNEFLCEIAPQLNGRKFIILGNHDYEGVEFYTACDFNVIKPFMMKYKGYEVSFDHYPCNRGVIQKGDCQIRVHGHIHNHGYQSVHEKKKERKRYGNINVSVEEIDYTPQPITRLLDHYIAGDRPKQQYRNVNRIGAKVRKAA